MPSLFKMSPLSRSETRFSEAHRHTQLDWPLSSRGIRTSPTRASISGWMATPQLYPILKASIILSSRVLATFFFVTWRIPRFGKLTETKQTHLWVSYRLRALLVLLGFYCISCACVCADLMVESFGCWSAMQIPLSHCFPTRLWAWSWGTLVSAVTSWTTTRAGPW